MVSLGVRGSTIPTTLLEFRCAPVGTDTALVRKPVGIYWVEVETLTGWSTGLTFRKELININFPNERWEKVRI